MKNMDEYRSGHWSILRDFTGPDGLALAVLLCAVDDLRSRHPLIRGKAQAYIAAEDKEWPFSFDNLVNHFGLGPDLLKAIKHRMIEAERRRNENHRGREER